MTTLTLGHGADLDNALVNQKDILIRWINDATEPEHLLKVTQYLGFVRPVWESVDYGYKVPEIVTRILDKAKTLADAIQEFMKGERKNSKTLGICLKDLRILNEIIATLS